jgi:transposase
MRKIEEILRLKYEAGLSHRAIAQSCSVSPSTVSEFVTHAKAAGLSWPLPEGINNEQLNDLLFPQRGPASGRNIQQPDWAEVHKELRRKSVTLSLLWVEYRQEQPDGYGYSQFCHHYRTWAKQLGVYVTIGRKRFKDSLDAILKQSPDQELRSVQ